MTIIQSSAIRDGKPVVEGSRVAVEDIVTRFFNLDRSIATISADLGLDEKDVEEALRYHHIQHQQGLNLEVEEGPDQDRTVLTQ